MKNLITTLLLCMSALLTTAAATIKVTGTTRYASTKETIPYCTISLCADDSAHTVIKKFPSSDVGAFSIEVNADTTTRYCLIFEAIGLDQYTRCFDVTAQSSDIKLGNIDLTESSTQLSEVSVVAQKPLVKMELDRLTYDTESDPETKTSNALDMLRKVPLVTVDGEDKIQVKGSTNFKIYINGKPSAMVSRNPEDVFRSLPASTIKRIEVITDPGAKYEAEGLNGILNIITYHSLVGYNGSVRVGADIWGGANAGGYFTTKIGKFGVTANLNYGTYNNPGSYGENIRTNLNPDIAIRQIVNQSKGMSRSHNMHGSLELSYEFDSLNLLSISAGGWGGWHNGTNTQNTQFLGADSLLLTDYNTSLRNSGSWSGINANVDYQHTFRKADQNLTASYRFDGSPNTNKSEMQITPLLNYHAYRQRSQSASDGQEHTFQLDYTEPWRNKMHTLEVGAKYILRINSSRNSNELFDTITGTWYDDPMIDDNNLNQLQHVVGAYASYSFHYKWFSLRAGGRLEHTTEQVEVTDTVLTPQFTNVVPSVSLSFKLSQTQNISVSYTQRLSRPGIWYLNPYYDNTDPLNINQGNPDLDVEIAHSVSLSYGLFTPKFNFNVSAWGSITNNSITSVQTMLNDSVTYTTYRNIGREASAGGNVYINWMIGKVARFNLNTMVNYNYFDARGVAGIDRETQGWHFGGNAGLQFFLPWELKLNFNGGYWSPFIGLQSRGDHWYHYSASIQRSFLKNSLTASIRANTFAQLWRTSSTTYTTDHYTTVNNQRYHGLSVSFNVSYTFGQMREQIRKVSRSISNDDVKSKQ